MLDHAIPNFEKIDTSGDAHPTGNPGAPDEAVYDRISRELLALLDAAKPDQTRVGARQSNAAADDEDISARTMAVRLELALASAKMGTWSWDLDSDRVDVDAQEREIWGLQPYGPYTVQDFFAVVLAEDLPRLQTAVAKSVEDGKDFCNEFRIRKPDGSVRWISGQGRTFVGQDGRVRFMTGVNYDITDRRQIELDLLDRRQEQASLERLGSIVGLTTAIAHEINQPLMAAKTYAHIIADQIASPTISNEAIAEAARNTADQLDRAAEVMRSLRLLIKFGKLNQASVKVADVIEACVNALRSEIQKANAEIKFNISGDLPNATADALQLELVILNLLRNALQAGTGMHGGRCAVLIAARQLSETEIEITVNDNGPGFSAQQRKYPFRAAVSAKRDGLGLGLSICKSIIDAHNGRMSIADTTQGATVHVILPVAT